jgi:hypothetical protein
MTLEGIKDIVFFNGMNIIQQSNGLKKNMRNFKSEKTDFFTEKYSLKSEKNLHDVSGEANYFSVIHYRSSFGPPAARDLQIYRKHHRGQGKKNTNCLRCLESQNLESDWHSNSLCSIVSESPFFSTLGLSEPWCTNKCDGSMVFPIQFPLGFSWLYSKNTCTLW